MAVKPNVYPEFSTSIDNDGIGTVTDPVSGQLNAQPPSAIGYSVTEGVKLLQFIPRQLLNHLFGVNNLWFKFLDWITASNEGRITVNEGVITSNGVRITDLETDVSTLDSDDVANVSTVAGATVTEALNTIPDEDLLIFQESQDTWYFAITNDNTLQEGDTVLPGICSEMRLFIKLQDSTDGASIRLVSANDITISNGVNGIGTGLPIFLYLVDSNYKVEVNLQFMDQVQSKMLSARYDNSNNYNINLPMILQSYNSAAPSASMLTLYSEIYVANSTAYTDLGKPFQPLIGDTVLIEKFSMDFPNI